MPRPDYNHPTWPSPRARLVAVKLGLDVVNGVRIKRLVHTQALELLAKKCRKTVPEFLEMSRYHSLLALGCIAYPPWCTNGCPYDPLYGPHKYVYD